ncbi:hypothetical protein EW146_g5624 [Bondarzewia mesenterica]|uniref:Uncharacterized protein n=1 Tax=Bondarzewia mesenterica TaxID=1095465 RepID=A0A4S4LSZ0_9AGAM|nr:hypothetical protein EW146_g5624 [Bondarzewia mesenterica]
MSIFQSHSIQSINTSISSASILMPSASLSELAAATPEILLGGKTIISTSNSTSSLRSSFNPFDDCYALLQVTPEQSLAQVANLTGNNMPALAVAANPTSCGTPSDIFGKDTMVSLNPPCSSPELGDSARLFLCNESQAGLELGSLEKVLHADILGPHTMANRMPSFSSDSSPPSGPSKHFILSDVAAGASLPQPHFDLNSLSSRPSIHSNDDNVLICFPSSAGLLSLSAAPQLSSSDLDPPTQGRIRRSASKALPKLPSLLGRLRGKPN